MQIETRSRMIISPDSILSPVEYAQLKLSALLTRLPNFNGGPVVSGTSSLDSRPRRDALIHWEKRVAAHQEIHGELSVTTLLPDIVGKDPFNLDRVLTKLEREEINTIGELASVDENAFADIFSHPKRVTGKNRWIPSIQGVFVQQSEIAWAMRSLAIEIERDTIKAAA